MVLPLSSIRRRKLLQAGATTLVALAAMSGLQAQAAPPVNTIKPGLFGGRSDVAIQGYDPVAYFTDGKAVKGQPGLVADYRGARWQFASPAHRELFVASPEKYAPQYGGYCAYGVSQDTLVGIEPDKFRVIDGKLYLNYDAEVQAKWLKDPAAYIRQADAKFQSLLAK